MLQTGSIEGTSMGTSFILDSPETALFLLCSALYQESQQPLSGNKGTPGETRKTKPSTMIKRSFDLGRYLANHMTRTESPVLADTN